MGCLVTTIDLNCDLGEGCSNDEALMPLITSANIACGGHAGDAATMRVTVDLANRWNVAIGAHPGFEDRENFGRVEVAVDPGELRTLLLRQMERLAKLARLQHVKLHGALYSMAARNREVAEVAVTTVAEFDPSMRLFALAGSELVAAARAKNLPVAEEVFADRTYRADGSLTPRSQGDALVQTEKKMLDQALEMVLKGTVRATNGSRVKIRADTLCLHGDGVHAVPFARALRDGLIKSGVQVRWL